MCKKKRIKRNVTVELEISFATTGEKTRDDYLIKDAIKLYDEMNTNFIKVYRKALNKLLENEDNIHKENRYREETIVNSSITKGVSFTKLLESLKE